MDSHLAVDSASSRGGSVRHLVFSAGRKYRLRSALGNQQPLAAPCDHDGDPSPFEVEGIFIELLVSGEIRPGVPQNRRVQRIRDAGLEETVDIGEQDHLFGASSARVEIAVELHFPRGQCAGFVAAEQVDTPEVLHGREMLHNHVFSRHADGPLRQGHAGDHGQEFRGEPYGQSHGEEK